MPTCHPSIGRPSRIGLPTCRLVADLPTCHPLHILDMYMYMHMYIYIYMHIPHFLARTALSESLLAPPTHQSLVSVPPTHQSLVSVHRHINPWCRLHRYINPWCRLHRHISPWCRFHRHINPWRRFGRRDRRFTDETWTGNRLSKVGRRRCTILMRMADRIRPATSSTSIR